jgi:hypothetical protein
MLIGRKQDAGLGSEKKWCQRHNLGIITPSIGMLHNGCEWKVIWEMSVSEVEGSHPLHAR